jgi:ferritin-like metal-binding protein YciE
MQTLKKLFLDGLAEIYDAETRLAWSMPRLVASATCDILQDAMAAHLVETEEHVLKLEGIFDSLGERARRKTNETTISLLNESLEVMSAFKGGPVINAALISIVQKIEHYEIATYGCLCDWAAVLGEKEVAGILQEMLDEDHAANQFLTELARSRSNREALNAGPAIRRQPPCDARPANGVDLEMERDFARFDTEAPTHESCHSDNKDRNGASVRREVAAALQATEHSEAKRRRTTDTGASHERVHRFVD